MQNHKRFPGALRLVIIFFRYDPGIFKVTGQHSVGKREVFNIDRTVAAKHINKTLKDKEIDEKAMCKKCTLQIILLISYLLTVDPGSDPVIPKWKQLFFAGNIC